MTGLSLGAADYITKPVNVVIARQRIRNLLERERLRKEVQMQAQHRANCRRGGTKPRLGCHHQPGRQSEYVNPFHGSHWLQRRRSSGAEPSYPAVRDHTERNLFEYVGHAHPWETMER